MCVLCLLSARWAKRRGLSLVRTDIRLPRGCVCVVVGDGRARVWLLMWHILLFNTRWFSLRSPYPPTFGTYYFVNLSDVTLKTLHTCNSACFACMPTEKEKHFLWGLEVRARVYARFSTGLPGWRVACLCVHSKWNRALHTGRYCGIWGNWNECERHTHNKSNSILTAVTFYRPSYSIPFCNGKYAGTSRFWLECLGVMAEGHAVFISSKRKWHDWDVCEPKTIFCHIKRQHTVNTEQRHYLLCAHYYRRTAAWNAQNGAEKN